MLRGRGYNPQQMSENAFTPRSFGPSPGRVLLLAAIAAGACVVARDMHPSPAAIPLWGVEALRVAIVAFPAILLGWLLSVRLSIDHVGVRYRSLFGERELRWDEVDELYAGAVRTLLWGLIPAGTRYSFRLRAGLRAEQRVENVRYIGSVKFTRKRAKPGTAARVLAFGSRFSKGEEISRLLADGTFAHVWRKVIQLYNDGADVSFGDDLVLSRDGVRSNPLGMFQDLMGRTIPWEQVRSYEVEKGRFSLLVSSSNGAARVYTKIDVAQIANFNVMMALLRQLRPLGLASQVGTG